MGSQETRALSDALLEEAARTGDLASTIRQRVTPGAVLHLPNGETGNIEFLAAFLHESAIAFPDVTLSSVRRERPRGIRFTMEGTHTGAFRGFGPTGKAVSPPICTVLRFEDGMTPEIWYYANLCAPLVATLGAPQT